MAANDDGLVLFSGYAKLPVGITASEMYKVIGVILVVHFLYAFRRAYLYGLGNCSPGCKILMRSTGT